MTLILTRMPFFMQIVQLKFCFVFAVSGIASFLPETSHGQSSSTNIKIVSFNIRYGTAADGDNHWDKRREFLIETIVTGDFNADQKSPPYEALFGAVDSQESPVVDTYRATHSERQPNEGTFSGFKANQNSGARIDWIGVSRDWKIQSAGIDRTSRDGRTPSDHFAVTAEVAF